MSVFQLKDGDLDRGPNGTGFIRVRGVDEARVVVKTRISLVRGEVKRSVNTGFDLYWAIQPETPDDHVANHINGILVGSPGVVDAVSKYNFEGETGVFTVQARINYTDDDQRERRLEHETFLIQSSGLVGAIGGPVNA